MVGIIVAGIVFDPLKRTIQARVDRVFDQKRFDYRETLVEFGRGINSQTDLRALLDSIVERLPQTLLVTRVAVFLASEGDGQIGLPGTSIWPPRMASRICRPRICARSMFASSTSTGRARTTTSSWRIRNTFFVCRRRSGTAPEGST